MSRKSRQKLHAAMDDVSDNDQTQAIFIDDFDDDDNTDEIDPDEGKKPLGFLKVLHQKGLKETIHPLYEGDNVIGRNADSCHVHIPSKSLSKEHACIQISGQDVLIFDKRSRNQTKRRQMYLTPEVRYEVREGDQLCFADVKCVFLGPKSQNPEVEESGSDTDESLILQRDVGLDSTMDIQPAGRQSIQSGNRSDVMVQETPEADLKRNKSRDVSAQPLQTLVLSESEDEDAEKSNVQDTVLCSDSDPETTMDNDLLCAATQAYQPKTSALEGDDEASLTDATQAFGKVSKSSTQSSDQLERNSTFGTQSFDEPDHKRANDSADSSTRPTQVFDEEEEDQDGAENLFAMATLAVDGDEVVDDSEDEVVCTEGPTQAFPTDIDAPTQKFPNGPDSTLAISESIKKMKKTSPAQKRADENKNLLSEKTAESMNETVPVQDETVAVGDTVAISGPQSKHQGRKGRRGKPSVVTDTVVIEEEEENDGATVAVDEMMETVVIEEEEENDGATVAVDKIGETVVIQEDEEEEEKEASKNVEEEIDTDATQACTDTVVVADDDDDDGDTVAVGETVPFGEITDTIIMEDEDEEERNGFTKITAKITPVEATQAYMMDAASVVEVEESKRGRKTRRVKDVEIPDTVVITEPTQAYTMDEGSTNDLDEPKQGRRSRRGKKNVEISDTVVITEEPTQAYAMDVAAVTESKPGKGQTKGKNLEIPDTVTITEEDDENTSEKDLADLQTQVYDDAAHPSPKSSVGGAGEEATQVYGLSGDNPCIGNVEDEDATQNFDIIYEEADGDGKEEDQLSEGKETVTAEAEDSGSDSEEESMLRTDNVVTEEPMEVVPETQTKAETQTKEEKATEIQIKNEANSEVSSSPKKSPKIVSTTSSKKSPRATDSPLPERSSKAEKQVSPTRSPKGVVTPSPKKSPTSSAATSKTNVSPAKSPTGKPTSPLKSALATKRSPSPSPTVRKRVAFAEEVEDKEEDNAEQNAHSKRNTRGAKVAKNNKKGSCSKVTRSRDDNANTTEVSKTMVHTDEPKEESMETKAEQNLSYNVTDVSGGSNVPNVKVEPDQPKGRRRGRRAVKDEDDCAPSNIEAKKEENLPTVKEEDDSQSVVKSTRSRRGEKPGTSLETNKSIKRDHEECLEKSAPLGRQGKSKRGTTSEVTNVDVGKEENESNPKRETITRKSGRGSRKEAAIVNGDGKKENDEASQSKMSKSDAEPMEIDPPTEKGDLSEKAPKPTRGGRKRKPVEPSLIESSSKRSRLSESAVHREENIGNESDEIASIASSVDSKDTQDIAKEASSSRGRRKRGVINTDSMASRKPESPEPTTTRTSSRGRKISSNPYMKDFETDEAKKATDVKKTLGAGKTDDSQSDFESTREVEINKVKGKKGKGKATLGNKDSEQISSPTTGRNTRKAMQGNAESQCVKNPSEEEQESITILPVATDKSSLTAVQVRGRGNRKRDQEKVDTQAERPSEENDESLTNKESKGAVKTNTRGGKKIGDKENFSENEASQLSTDLDSQSSDTSSGRGRRKVAKEKTASLEQQSTPVRGRRNTGVKLSTDSQASEDASENSSQTSKGRSGRAQKAGNASPATPNGPADKGKKRGANQNSQFESPVTKASRLSQQSTPASAKGKSPLAKVVNSPSLRKSTVDHIPKIMFTGVIDEQGEKIVKDLGGEIAPTIQECSHLVTDKVRRTVKFLAGLAKGIHIVSPQWLTSCKQAGTFLDGQKYLVSDPAMEKQYKFNLASSITKAQHHRLFEGYSLHVTPSVRPDPSQMQDIIQCAGGKFLKTMPTKQHLDTIVISCEADQKASQPAIKAGIPVVGAEFVLTGILRQEVNIDLHDFSRKGTQGSKSNQKK